MSMKYLVLAIAVAVTVEAAYLGDTLLSQKRQGSTQFVAFSAGMTKTTNISDTVTLKFDKVWTNTGLGYDNTTGVFTAPVDGVYDIIYHALTETAGTMKIDLYKNDQYQVTGYAHNTQDYASASNSVVLVLSQGDRIYLKARGTDNIYGMTDEIYATFSGFLLAAQSA